MEGLRKVEEMGGRREVADNADCEKILFARMASALWDG